MSENNLAKPEFWDADDLHRLTPPQIFTPMDVASGKVTVDPANANVREKIEVYINDLQLRFSAPIPEDDKYLELKTCNGVKKFICDKMALPVADVEVHKTDTYLVVTYSIGGKMAVKKMPLPGRVLYCLKQSDIQPLFDDILKAKPA